MRAIDLTGRKLGRWTVVRRESNSDAGGTRWFCRCDCGNEKIVNGIVLRDGRSRSCGCLHDETCIQRSTKHGHATNGITPTYHSWAGMVARCTNPKNEYYRDYGGRGIVVCERWMTFANFLADMGEKPSGTSIERRNNDGRYEQSNCYWATRKQQARNKRNNRRLTLHGVTRTISEWSEITGINPSTISDRLRRGWTDEASLTTTVRR